MDDAVFVKVRLHTDGSGSSALWINPAHVVSVGRGRTGATTIRTVDGAAFESSLPPDEVIAELTGED